ncbi:MAG: imidazole glycerol phosphate synthase subunit HisH [Phototrophicales bacterium]|nr:MAG: imidazole glycerol phosphate synthase subunit HisH [Phototrophicales bacterium]
MIAVIDYGAGNLRSVYNALSHLGADVRVIADPKDLASAEKIVLPGVGAFGAGMKALQDTGFIDPIYRAVEAGKPLIGICLGMQYLFERSEEMGEHAGLGLLAGKVIKFPENEVRIPHIGWNQLHIQREHSMFRGIADGSYAYFVHSYYVEPTEPNVVLACTDYGIHYASVVGKDNIVGIQCHPEKSQSVGLQFLKNFVEWKT